MGVEPGLELRKELEFMVGKRDTHKNISGSNSKFLFELLYSEDHQINSTKRDGKEWTRLMWYRSESSGKTLGSTVTNLQVP
jgi:hypothetical protein